MPTTRRGCVPSTTRSWLSCSPRRRLSGSPSSPARTRFRPPDFWQEIAALHRYGLDAETAIASATSTARSYLGLRDLEEGAPADVVLYDADPRDDPEVLERPALVMVGGEVIAKRSPSA
jgi:cytosine/adenosine deaminase-related metal-dependent hydrolase